MLNTRWLASWQSGHTFRMFLSLFVYVFGLLCGILSRVNDTLTTTTHIYVLSKVTTTSAILSTLHLKTERSPNEELNTILNRINRAE